MQAHPIGHLRLADQAQSKAFAKALAPLLGAGDTVLLEGPIGAGKSFLSRAIIQTRLAAENRLEDVPSPTFTLVQTYELTSVEIWHCDLYRLTSVDEVLELGLEEAFETAICLIEWPDRLEDLTPENALHLVLEMPENDDRSRDLTLLASEEHWSDRLGSLMETFGK